MNVSVAQRFELIKMLASVASVRRVCQEYGVNKQTLSDICKAKYKHTEYAVKYSVDGYSSKSGAVAAHSV